MSPETEPPKPVILAVDDTPENLRLIKTILSQDGFTVRSAPSGEYALQYVENAWPDLILLDIKMPEMDGYEVCRRLKNREHTRRIPIIFISALNETIDKVRAFSLGAVDYITKPFQADEVLARIRTHLTLCRLQNEMEEKNRELLKEVGERIRTQEMLHWQTIELQHRLTEREQLISQLIEAGSVIKTLRQLLPICSSCKKIRNDSGYWEQIEVYFRTHAEVDFSHSICPECMIQLYPPDQYPGLYNKGEK